MDIHRPKMAVGGGETDTNKKQQQAHWIRCCEAPCRSSVDLVLEPDELNPEGSQHRNFRMFVCVCKQGSWGWQSSKGSFFVIVVCNQDEEGNSPPSLALQKLPMPNGPLKKTQLKACISYRDRAEDLGTRKLLNYALQEEMCQRKTQIGRTVLNDVVVLHS